MLTLNMNPAIKTVCLIRLCLLHGPHWLVPDTVKKRETRVQHQSIITIHQGIPVFVLCFPYMNLMTYSCR